jgi:predicted small lipoprotein YifL
MRRAFVVVALGALAACGGKPPIERADSPGIEKATFQDVPIPDGLNYDRGTGHKTPDGSIRVYTQELSGRRSLEEVAAFYRGTLPKHHGWWLTNETPGPPAKLSFVKGKEMCDVTITPTQSTPTAGGVSVVVKLDYRPDNKK